MAAPTNDATRRRIADLAASGTSHRAIGAAVGVSHTTVSRVLASATRTQKIRSASEFDIARLAYFLQPPKTAHGEGQWSLADVFAARDLQMLGRFARPARLAEAMRTDDALFTAYENRLAPQRCIGVKLVPACQDARALAVCAEAQPLFGPGGVGIHADTLSDINGCLVNHGIAIGCNVATPRDDGSRIDFEMRYWPIEWVRWDPIYRVLRTQIDPDTAPPPGVGTTDGWETPIVHGDGRWVVFKKHEFEPWKQEACILPAGVVWARHAYANRDWAKGSVAHGNAKVVGEMPAGMALQGDDGGLTPEALAFLELLKAIASLDMPVGIRPAGSKTDYITNNSSAWQVWAELVKNAEKAAARIYLGTDGTLGTTNDAPGVDLSALFGVAETKVQGDLKAIERGILTGTIEPWAAVNFGSSALAPSRCYLLPDGEEDANRDSLAKRNAAFYADMKGAHDAGMVLEQAYIDAHAADYGVRAPVVVQAAPAPAPTAPPAPAANAPPPVNAVDAAPPSDEAAAALAASMTEHGITKCEHGSINRCRLCGIERERVLVPPSAPGLDDHSWQVRWRPIAGAY